MPTLQTVAESTSYKATSRHADVLVFIEALAPLAGDKLSVQTMGASAEGRELPVLVLSADKLFTPEKAHRAAKADGRPVVMIVCNIHAGEVEGKEAALMLARDMLVGGKHAKLMSRATIVFVPLYNPDGNDLIDPKHRALD